MKNYEQFVIEKSINDFNHYYRVNPVPFYDEADLLKDIRAKDLHGYVDNTLTMEHYNSINFISGYWVVYCYNSLIPFARKEKYVDGYGSLFMELHDGSSILEKGDDGIREIDVECPKVAWGFTAFLITHARFDDKNRLRYVSQRKEVGYQSLMQEYLSSQFTIYKKLKEDDYNYNSINKLDDRNRALDIAFYESHIKQEKELISRTEQQGNNIAKGFICYFKDYIQFVEEELRKLNAVNFSKDNNNYNLPKYDDNLLSLFYNNEKVIDKFISRTQNMKGIKVVNEILALRELHLIKSSKEVSNKQLHDIIGTIAKLSGQSAFDNALILDSSGRNKERRISKISTAKNFYNTN